MSQIYRKSRCLPIPPFRDVVRNIVFRPRLISSSNAMLWGVAWLIVGAIAGWYYDIVPATLLGYTWGYASLLGHVKLAIYLGLCSTIVFAMISIRYGNTSFVDVVGRMLYARSPLTLMMLLGIWGDRVVFSTLTSNPAVAFEQMLFETAMMVIPATLIMLWYLYWSYTAFRSVMNMELLRRLEVVLWYFVCLVLSYGISVAVLQL